jgi:hypothetical protein
MDDDNSALTRLLTANIIGFLAARYSDEHDAPLADSLQLVMNSKLYQKLIEPRNALYCESLPLLYEQIT